MNAPVVIVGIGNRYRRDDGVGPAVAGACAARNLPGVRVLSGLADPTDLLDAWSGAELAVLVDAAVDGEPPGTIRHRRIDDLAHAPAVSSHGLDITSVVRLGRALDRLPGAVAVVTVEAADTGYGPGLTPAVADAVHDAVEAVLAEIAALRSGPRRRPSPAP